MWLGKASEEAMPEESHKAEGRSSHGKICGKRILDREIASAKVSK